MIWTYLIAIILVLIGGLNWGLVGAFDFNLVDKMNFGKTKLISRTVYILVGLAAIYLALSRNTYLPFLGRTAVPLSQIDDYHVFDSETIEIDVPEENAVKVIYWAAESGKTTADDPQTAYATFKNSGIVPVINNKAILYFQCPRQYKVNRVKILPKHIHYRIAYDNGMTSEVKTIYPKC